MPQCAGDTKTMLDQIRSDDLQQQQPRSSRMPQYHPRGEQTEPNLLLGDPGPGQVRDSSWNVIEAQNSN